MRSDECHADALRRRRARRGLTLVELLVSAALGLVVLSAAAAVLLAAGRMKRNQELLSDANEEARTALRHVTRALAAAGAGGPSYSYLDGSGVRQERLALLFTNGTQALDAATMPQTPDSLVLLRYGADRRTVLLRALGGNLVQVAPDPRDPALPGVTPHLFLPGEAALITNFQRSMLLTPTSATLNAGAGTVDLGVGAIDAGVLQDPLQPVEPGATVFPVRLIRYRVVYVPAAAGVPERADLVEESLEPQTLAVRRQVVLARNIEDFQVEWAYDRNDDGVADDGGSGAYTDAGPQGSVFDPSLTFARVSLSARTSGELLSDEGQGMVAQDGTPFERGLDLGAARPPATGHRRRVLSTVVLLKNLASTRL